jgi:hypothetical protein
VEWRPNPFLVWLEALMADSESSMLLLGEIRGQLRELIHNSNNNSAKLDALSIRVGLLENKEAGRTGASNLVYTILKSPTIGWLVGAAVSAWAVLTGKVHI